jgi:HAD superfamily hydrolase (TIGR01509 family)
VFDLVIFDCDGVLVDSERLTIRTEARVLTELGWPISEAEIIDRFVGRSATYMLAEIERTLGRSVDWDREFVDPVHAVFDAELRAVDGVLDVVDALARRDVPTAVASSSTHDSIAFKFALTGVDRRFDAAVFSTEDVANGKPAPDVFLLAARSFDTDPSRCAVVEDSVAGVQAGLAAGMTVFGFAGGVTARERLEAPGVVVFDRMDELASLLLGDDARASTR